ncbi:GFA family protein [Paraferrimonas sedimenticola]|uniref:Aldehyde-activating protein n=1 Tax=Paraferrimonas sedimenticola TaxID=375674 RepID=A0AA37RTQ8_9GAMM|nr:GFA family protein [Paraferrimonas sedimenticola]GLP95106.1 aldehyde-activating protein [Paraferrimonas sedimenticola]
MKGSCLCGTVTFEVTPPFLIFQFCHCRRCQKFTGSAHASNLIVRSTQLSWLTGEDNIGRYEVSEARHFATAFCKTCGSCLPWESQQGGNTVVPAGSLDEDPQVRPTQNVFCAFKAAWDTSSGDLPEFDAFPEKNIRLTQAP